MSVNFSNFTSGTAPSDTDQVVGYVSASSGGERRWTIANLRNSLITGAATTIDTENLTASRALISNSSGKVDVSNVTLAELNALEGISTTATIQAQINGKGPGTVTSVTGTAPISVATGTTTPAISITTATQSAGGIMSAADKIKLDGLSQGIALSQFTGTNQSLATNGYQKFPGGLIIQWGLSPSYNTQSQQTITLPISFPNSTLNVNATWDMSVYEAGGNGDTFVQVLSFTRTSITFIVQNATNANFTSGRIYWSAIGH